MRGAPGQHAACGFVGRIIPADAGSTTSIPRIILITRDHPRGCGEHDGMDSDTAIEAGSSPRMRGALHVRMIQTSLSGIIPADAGSTQPPHRKGLFD